MKNIPVIDLSDALVPGAPRSAAAAAVMREAAMSSGFFYVINHGIDRRQVEEQFALARRFFNLDMAEKQSIDLNLAGKRGYEAIGAQTLDAGARPDMKESFYCGLNYGPEHPYVQRGYHSYGRNQWPPSLPEMEPACQAYIAAMLSLSGRLMQLMALSLGLTENYFDHTAESPMVTLRLLRYPPHPADADERTFGAGAHTDWGAITILAQDVHGGLEVQMPDGTWVEATPLDGSFVVNLGDMIPRWTNGRYHSNPHRVRNRYSGGEPRFSIPFFYSPDYEAMVSPIAGCIPAGEQAKYAPCSVGEHLREMYEKTYGKAAAGTLMA